MYTDQFLDHLAFQKRYSEHTIKAYRTDLLEFAGFLEREKEIKWDGPQAVSEITHHMIREWIISLMDGGINPRSINRKLSSLKSFFKYLLRQGICTGNPAAKISAPKQKKQLLRVASEDEVGDLLEKDYFAHNQEWGNTERAIFHTFYHTGMRLSELINLKVSNVDFNQKKLTVTGKRNKERNIPLTPVLEDLLRQYLAHRELEHGAGASPHLFLTKKGNKLYPKLVYNTINNYLRLVSGLEKKSPHVLRHSFATHMLNRGADLTSIKELLGHSNLAATQIYTHNTIDQLKLMYNHAHPRGDSNSHEI